MVLFNPLTVCELRSESKIRQLEITVAIKEQILRLEVSVAEIVLVNVFQGTYELFEIESCCRFTKRATSEKQIEKV